MASKNKIEVIEYVNDERKIETKDLPLEEQKIRVDNSPVVEQKIQIEDSLVEKQKIEVNDFLVEGQKIGINDFPVRKRKYEINDLPVECLAGIFDNLTICAILKMKLVCKKWCEAAKISSNRYPITLFIGKEFKIQFDDREIILNDLIIYEKNEIIKSKNITSINFDSIPSDFETFIEKLVKILKTNCNNLKGIRFSNLWESPVYTKTLETILERCPNLKEFISSGLPLKYHQFVQQLQARLEWFEVSYCYVKLPPLQFQQLKTFKYKYSIDAPDYSILANNTIFQSKLINLEMEIPSHLIISEFINQLGKLCPNLQSLELIDRSKHEKSVRLSYVLGEIATKFPKLLALKLISGYYKSETSRATHLGIVDFMTKLPQLQSLKLNFDRFQGNFRASLLERISDVSKNLQILEISEIYKITPNQLLFLRNMPKLRGACFYRARLVCECENDARLISRTIKECVNLEYLIFHDLSPKDDKGRFKKIIRDEYTNDNIKNGFTLIL